MKQMATALLFVRYLPLDKDIETAKKLYKGPPCGPQMIRFKIGGMAFTLINPRDYLERHHKIRWEAERLTRLHFSSNISDIDSLNTEDIPGIELHIASKGSDSKMQLVSVVSLSLAVAIILSCQGIPLVLTVFVCFYISDWFAVFLLLQLKGRPDLPSLVDEKMAKVSETEVSKISKYANLIFFEHRKFRLRQHISQAVHLICATLFIHFLASVIDNHFEPLAVTLEDSFIVLAGIYVYAGDMFALFSTPFMIGAIAGTFETVSAKNVVWYTWRFSNWYDIDDPIDGITPYLSSTLFLSFGYKTLRATMFSFAVLRGDMYNSFWVWLMLLPARFNGIFYWICCLIVGCLGCYILGKGMFYLALWKLDVYNLFMVGVPLGFYLREWSGEGTSKLAWVDWLG
ncbi:hypothetical protein TWF694_006247 [Orbilia ellipsospora]|uniref:Uncharacterized protein n=1 Tax=Orbilia ellipsospora TaxID=2528407 RepID=A0AAV9XMY2_9PEZI